MQFAPGVLMVLLDKQGEWYSTSKRQIPSRFVVAFKAHAVFDHEQYEAFNKEGLEQFQPWNCGLTGGAFTICCDNWHMTKEVLLLALELKYCAFTIFILQCR